MAIYRIKMTFCVEAADEDAASGAAHDVMEAIRAVTEHVRDPERGSLFRYGVEPAAP